MYYIYVLQSGKDGNLYIGCTSNLAQRLKAHQNGLVRSTRSRLPLSLVYRESYDNIHEAYRAERSYKTAGGKRQLKRKIKDCQIV